MVPDPRLAWLETTLHQQIPFSRAMQVPRRRLRPDGLALAAPLAPNSNHAATRLRRWPQRAAYPGRLGLIWLLLDEA